MHFSVIFNFSLLDPDPGGKMNTDPRPCCKLLVPFSLWQSKTNWMEPLSSKGPLTLISRALEKNLQLLFITILHHDALS